METLRPIPTPPGQMWRELRLRIGPFLVFAGIFAAAAFTWRSYVVPNSIVGQVENAKLDVISTVAGELSELAVDRFETVKKGQLIGKFCTSDPERLKASLLAIKTDLDVMRARIALDERRNELNYESLKINLLAERAELSALRTDWTQAMEQHKRTQALFQEKVASQMELDIASRDQERLRSSVEEKANLVAELQEALVRLEPAGAQKSTHPNVDFITEALEAKRSELMLLEGPVELYAPADGVISAVSCRPGQKVMAGTPIVTIAQPAERIVGYIRQPVQIVPKVGSRVEIRTRGPHRQIAAGEVVRVGGDMQYVTSPMRVRGFENAQELGLPFLVSRPPGLHVVAGELVDLVLLD